MRTPTVQEIIDGRPLPPLPVKRERRPRSGWGIDWPPTDDIIARIRAGDTLTAIGADLECSHQAVKLRLVRRGRWNEVEHLVRRGRQKSQISGQRPVSRNPPWSQ